MAIIDKISAIADAIRSKTGTTDTMTLAQMPDLINGIQTGGDISYHIEEQTLENDSASLDTSRTYLDGIPSVYISYSAFAESVVSSSTSGHLCAIHILESQTSSSATYSKWTWHYNTGTSKNYAPYVQTVTVNTDSTTPIPVAGASKTATPRMMYRAGVTYKTIFIYGGEF